MTPYQYLPALGKQLVIWKVILAVLATIADVLALAAFRAQLVSVPGSKVLVASLVLRMVASLSSIPLVYLEFFRSYSATPAFTLYLTIATLCDMARVRTFAFTVLEDSTFFFAAFTAGFACRVLSWFLETAPKGAFVERAEGDRYISGEETSSFVAKLFITCVDPILIKGFRHPLTIQSLGPIQSRYESEYLFEIGQPLWEKHLASGKKHPLLRTMFSAFGTTLLAPILPCIIYSLASITQPTLINHVISFIESYQDESNGEQEPVSHGWGLVGAYALIFLITTFSWALFQMSALRSSVAMRGFLVQMIYRKALRVHQDTAKEVGAGSSTSLMSVDVERIVLQCEPFHLLYSALIMVLIGLVILYNTVGASFVATIIVAVAFFASIPFLTKTIPHHQKMWSGKTDLRVKLVNSAIRNIKAIKMSGYEDIIVRKLEELRDMEVHKQVIFYKWLLIVSAVTNWLKGMLSLATLVTYSIVSLHSSSHAVTTGVFFTAIAVLDVITNPLLIVGQRYASIMAATASIKRIEDFLRKPEKEDNRINAERIEAKDAAFGTSEVTLLTNVNMTIPMEKLTMIVGPVGSGKTTLLDGLMGEMNILKGSLTFPTDASVGFCAQDAWLRPGDSIRQNIQFQAAFNPALYRSVIKACALDIDMRIWPQGDKQKAQGLSGGQKQRIALARSLYARPDVLILDDIFSALDKTTEQHIFSALFGTNGLFVGKTVILATNAVHRLPSADYVVVISDGTVSETGSFSELLHDSQAIKDLLDIAGSAKHEESSKPRSTTAPADDAGSSYIASLAEATEDIDSEMAASQAKKNSLILFCTMGGTTLFCASFIVLLLASAIPSVIPVYVQAWTTAIQRDSSQLLRYMGGYIGIEIGHICCFLISITYFYIVYSSSSSRKFHAKEVRSIFRAPLSYFEDKPIGRILSRFSQDLYVCDFEMPMSAGNVIGLGTEMLATAVILTVAAPYVGIIILGTVILCIAAQRFYVRTSRQVRRMDFVAKSPLYTLFAETMDTAGLKTIRAVRAQEGLSRQSVSRGNTSQVPYYLMVALKKWLNLVLGLVVTIINVGLVTIAVLTRSSTSSGLLAVALVQATSLVFTLNYTILAAAEFETCLVAVSRVQEVVELPAEEGPADSSNALVSSQDPSKEENAEKGKLQNDDWVTSGSVRFSKVVFRYKPELPPALNDISFRVQGGHSVGIVGRTGCGKSTALQALFRMVECEQGSIHIDGVDIRSIPRAMLRKAMTIIPQDPLLLEMSIRENLDLEGIRSDPEIWAALERTQCKSLVESLPDKLDTMVTGEGGNFSRGERQLLAMARALLRDRKILVLDEASSSLDVATDATIQKVLREAFAGRTIIAIAHRLHTLKDFDQIVVLANGQVIEDGRPQDLLANPNGPFSLLYRGEGQSEDVASSLAGDDDPVITEM